MRLFDNVGFDFDGVISDTYNIFRGHFWDAFDIDIGSWQNQRKFMFDAPGIPFEKQWAEIQVAIIKYQQLCPACEGSIEALQNYHNKRERPIYILSAREPSSTMEMVTRTWLDKHLKIPYELQLVDMSEDKRAILIDREIKYYVDDRFKTVNELADILDISFLFRQPRNFGRTITKQNIKRVDNLTEMLEMVKNAKMQTMQ